MAGRTDFFGNDTVNAVLWETIDFFEFRMTSKEFRVEVKRMLDDPKATHTRAAIVTLANVLNAALAKINLGSSAGVQRNTEFRITADATILAMFDVDHISLLTREARIHSPTSTSYSARRTGAWGTRY